MKKLEDYEKDDWELIETLWNVNSAAALIVELRSKGINRNIVECKLDLSGR